MSQAKDVYAIGRDSVAFVRSSADAMNWRSGLTDSALNLEVAAMFNTMAGDRVAAARQALLLGIVAEIQKSGAALAHPVRRVELVRSEEAQATLELKGGRRFQTVLPAAAATDSSKRS